MKRILINKSINLTIGELKNIYESAETLSVVARLLFGSNCYSCREEVKKIAKDNNLLLPCKKERHYYCLFCGKEILGKDRKRKKFCNHSCSASFNNKGVKRNNSKIVCKECGKSSNGKEFCSTKCKNTYKLKCIINDIESGKGNGCYNNTNDMIKLYREYILLQHDNKCDVCGWNEKNPYTGKPILQIHHIDGNCTNNKEENLQVLCPNHHCMTENFGSRNKNCTRRDKRTKIYWDNIKKEK